MSSIELQHVTVRRSGSTVLDDVSLSVADGELVGIVGASGAGKTMLLRAIAGLEPLAAGAIAIDGIDVSLADPGQRGVSMVFQTPALIPHFDVRRNIAFALEIDHTPETEIAIRVAAEARAMHIVELLGRSPRHLSAGEAQLVQVAKALVRRPKLLLLDEPLARVDPPVSHQLRLELRLMQQGYGVTTFATTNDPLEAMALPDRLVVLDGGRVIQTDSPFEVYERPLNLVVASCTGHMSTLTVEVEPDREGFWLVHPAFRRRAWHRALAEYAHTFVTMGLRPAWLSVTADGPIRAEVTEADPVSGVVSACLVGDQRRDVVEVAVMGAHHRRGDHIALRIDQVALFDPVTGDLIV